MAYKDEPKITLYMPWGALRGKYKLHLKSHQIPTLASDGNYTWFSLQREKRLGRLCLVCFRGDTMERIAIKLGVSQPEPIPSGNEELSPVVTHPGQELLRRGR